MAIIATKVEKNLVTINPSQLSNPKFTIAFYVEIIEEARKPWGDTHVRSLLIVHGIKYELTEVTDPDKRQSQTFEFALLEDVNPQVERIIERAIPDAL